MQLELCSFLYRYPDCTMIIRVRLFAIDTVIPLYTGISTQFILWIAGEPFLKDSSVHSLKRFRDWSDTVEYCPVTAGKFIDDHTFRHISACVFTGNEIPELPVSYIIYADTILADTIVHQCLLVRIRRCIPGIYIECIFLAYLIPVLWNLSVCKPMVFIPRFLHF